MCVVYGASPDEQAFDAIDNTEQNEATFPKRTKKRFSKSGTKRPKSYRSATKSAKGNLLIIKLLKIYEFYSSNWNKEKHNFQ